MARNILHKSVTKRHKYYATGKHTKVYQKLSGDFTLEYNSSIKQYRINSGRGIVLSLMGYSPHRKALLEQYEKYTETNRRA